MPEVLQRELLEAGAGARDERRARAELRRQIGALERQLGRLVAEAFPRFRIDAAVPPAARRPRALDLGELEAVRDSLAARVAEGRRAHRERAELEAENRRLLERMLAAPAEHRWLRISRQDLGLPGCGHWHSLPRLGPIGMMLGWWRVRISSGCPLPGRLAAAQR